MNQIDDDILERSEVRKKKKSSVWMKWGAMAACLCLLIGVLVPLANSIFNAKGGGDFQDGVPAEPALIYFQGALYQCVYAEDALKRVGLPSEITEDLAGEHVAYLEMGGSVDYQETIKETDTELFQYAPAPTRAVYILRDGDNYMVALFNRTYFPDDKDAYTDLAETYRFFDISGASDIRHICDNLRSLELVKMEYNEPTALDYTLRFYDEAGILIESLEISSHNWIAYDGYFHYAGEGEFDRKFIDELVDIALSSGPKV